MHRYNNILILRRGYKYEENIIITLVFNCMFGSYKGPYSEVQTIAK